MADRHGNRIYAIYSAGGKCKNILLTSVFVTGISVLKNFDAGIPHRRALLLFDIADNHTKYNKYNIYIFFKKLCINI